jgi:hypothetical protein
VSAASPRFAIKRSAWVRPLLLLFGATPERSFVEIRGACLRARFGWYQVTIPIEDIETVEPSDWPWYGGIGWRTNMRSVIGLVGSLAPVVRISLSRPVRTRLLLIPIRLRELYLSLEDADGFIAALADARPAPR